MCTYAHAQAHAPGYPHTTHARTHTQTNTQYLLLFHGKNDSRTHLSVTLYVHGFSRYCLTVAYRCIFMLLLEKVKQTSMCMLCDSNTKTLCYIIIKFPTSEPCVCGSRCFEGMYAFICNIICVFNYAFPPQRL